MRKPGLSGLSGPAPRARRATGAARSVVTVGAILVSLSEGIPGTSWPPVSSDPTLLDHTLPADGVWKSLAEGSTAVVHNLPSHERANHLLALAVRTREEIAGELGEYDTKPLTLYLCKDARSFGRVAGAQPGDEQVGVALPGKRAIVIRAFRGGRPTDLSETIVHEIAHIMLADAAGADLPRWFHEGFALYQSHQLTIPEAFHLTLAGVAGRLIPLSEMDGRFPYGTRLSRLAYAQSLDAFSYLSSQVGLGGIGALVRGVRRHGSFALAFRTVYGAGGDAFDAAWRASLTKRYRWVLLTSGWVPLLLVVTVMAGLLKRRAARRTLAGWDTEAPGGTGAGEQGGGGAEET